MYEKEFKMVFFLFDFVGMHPKKKMRKPLVIFNFILTLYITILILLRMVLEQELVVMESIGVFSQIWLKFIILTTKREKLIRVIEDTQHFWEKDVEGSENQKLLRYLDKGMKTFLCYIFPSTCMFLLKPLLVRGTTIYYYYTIEQIPFVISYAIEFYVTVVTMAMVIGCNALISIMIVIGAGQFSNLNAKMRQLDLRHINSKEDFDKSFNELNDNIKYHGFLIDYVNRLNDIFTILFGVLMGIVTSLLCMSMYVISLPNTGLVDYVRAGCMVCALTSEFLLLYGYPAQTLLDEAEEMSNSAFYYCQWYLPNLIPLRKNILMMIRRSQKPVSLSAAGLIDINRQTVVSMLKTAYSFFTFLQTMETEAE